MFGINKLFWNAPKVELEIIKPEEKKEPELLKEVHADGLQWKKAEEINTEKKEQLQEILEIMMGAFRKIAEYPLAREIGKQVLNSAINVGENIALSQMSKYQWESKKFLGEQAAAEVGVAIVSGVGHTLKSYVYNLK